MKVKQSFLNGNSHNLISDNVLFDIFITGYFSPEEVLEDEEDQKLVRKLIQDVLKYTILPTDTCFVEFINEHPTLINSKLQEFINIVEDIVYENMVSLEESSVTSYGHYIIGEYNPNELEEVRAIKEKAIEFINLINGLGLDQRRVDLAIDHIEIGTMLAVKSLFES